MLKSTKNKRIQSKSIFENTRKFQKKIEDSFAWPEAANPANDIGVMRTTNKDTQLRQQNQS